MLGELVQPTNLKWITHPPTRCPTDSALPPGEVLVVMTTFRANWTGLFARRWRPPLAALSFEPRLAFRDRLDPTRDYHNMLDSGNDQHRSSVGSQIAD